MSIRRKTIIVLMVALFSIILLGTTKVNAQATVKTGKAPLCEIDNTILDNIPNTINVNLKESEFEKVSNVLFENVQNEFKKKNIELKDTTNIGSESKSSINVWIESVSTNDIYDIYKFKIEVSKDDYEKEEYDTIATKEINITYNNSSNRNNTDKNYVENLLKNLSKNSKNQYEFLNFGDTVENILQETIKDKDISFKNINASGMGGRNLFGLELPGVYGVFKNDVYYTYLKTYSVPGIKISVPSNIENTEKAYIDYATKILNKDIEEYNKESIEYDEEIITLEKIEKADNGYYKIYYKETYNGNSKDCERYLLLEKEISNLVKKEDSQTGIKLETNSNIVPSNTIISSKIVVEQKTLDIVDKALNGKENKYKVYDINLLKDGAKIQPNGKVKISIPIPSDYDKENIEIYRVDENGEKTKYNVTIEGDYAVIETDHFSTYVLAEKKVENEQTNISTEVTNKNEKDNTPKTGTIDVIYFILPVMIISALGVVVFNKKH